MKKLLSFLFFLSLLLTACGPEVQQHPVEIQPELIINSTPTVEETLTELQPASTPQSTALSSEATAPLIDAPSIIFIDMLDEIYGWAVTETQIIRTNDGGVTWYNITPEGLAETGYSVVTEFFDVNHAWIQAPDVNNYPNGGTLYRTSDGGLTWNSNPTPFSGGDISFVDSNNGWMMADLGAGAGSMAVSVFQTDDGGATWNRTYTNDPNLDNAGGTLPLGGQKGMIVALDNRTAWIGGVVYSTGTIYLFRTDDNGKTWSQIDFALSLEAQNSELMIDQIKFFSPTQGFLALRINSDNSQTVIYETNDGGNTWTLAPAKITSTGRLEIVSAQEIIFYSSDQFYVTKDAAKTWSIVPPDVAFGDSLTDMSFANSNTGWVITTDPVNNHRTLYKTIDGGATWFPIIP